MLFTLETLFLRGYMRIFKLVTAKLPIVWPQEFIGAGAIQELLRHIQSQGYTRVFVVTDHNLVNAGVVAPVLAELDALKLSYSVYDTIQPDTPAEQIEAGLLAFVNSGAEAVLAIGGGSVIDAAKLIAARALNPKPVLKLGGLFKVRKGIQPLFVIPTTAGTGSEVTIAAVVSDTAAQRKLAVIDPRLIPSAMALDAQIMLGLPPAITAATGMDALTHAIEAFVSKNATAETDVRALNAAKRIFKYLPEAFHNGSNEQARQQMAEASKLAGQAFTIAGVGYVHAIAHNLGARYHLPHGLANAIVMPHVLSASLPQAAPRLAKLARHCGLHTSAEGASDMEQAKALIEKIMEMNKEFAIPTYVEALQPGDIAAISKAARAEARFTYAVPRYFTHAQMQIILHGMLKPTG